MSTLNGVYASGAGKDEAELRRRNVQSYEKTNGGAIYKLEAEDTKKVQKVGEPGWGLKLHGSRADPCDSSSLMLTAADAVEIGRFRVLGRLGVLNRTTHLHSLCSFYALVEDRPLPHCDLG